MILKLYTVCILSLSFKEDSGSYTGASVLQYVQYPAHVNGEDWTQFALCLMIAVTGHLALHVYEIPICMGIHT